MQQKKVDTLQLAMDVHNDNVKAAPMAVDAAWPKDPSALSEKAWPLVNPDREPDEYGKEPLGLALIQQVIALVPADDEGRHVYLDTLAWARFANGLFEEARAASKEAWEAAPETEKPEYQGYREKLERAIADCAESLS